MPTDSSKDQSDHSTVSAADGFSVGGGSASSKLRNKFPSTRNGRRGETGGINSPYRTKQVDVSQMKESNSSYGGGTPNSKGTVQSFVPNSEMTRIRNAEHVILNEEGKYGRLDRDPRGRIVPEDQVNFCALFVKETNQLAYMSGIYEASRCQLEEGRSTRYG